MGRVNAQNPCYASFGPEADPRPLAACGYFVGPCLVLRNVRKVVSRLVESYVDVH